MPQWVFVVCSMEVTLRFGDQPIPPDRPLFKAADANLLPRSSRAGIRAGQSPVVLRLFVLDENVMHFELQVRKRGHECLNDIGNDSGAPHRGYAAVHGKRRIRRKECRNALGILAAPRHGVAQSKIPKVDWIELHRASFCSKAAFTCGHSRSIMLYQAESRKRPPAQIMWFRKMPSNLAPMRRIALRERSFSASVFSSTRMHPSASKAWRNIRYFASVFTTVRCHGRPIHVAPISTCRFTLSIFM